MAEFKPVIFHVGSELYAVDIALVKGIEKVETIVNIPNSVPYVKGIMNLRGDIVPVISLRVKFNIQQETVSDKTDYIVVSVNDMLIALETDGVREIKDMRDSQIHDVPPLLQGNDTDYVKSVMNVDNKLVLVLNVFNLFSPSEREHLEQMLEQMEK